MSAVAAEQILASCLRTAVNFQRADRRLKIGAAA